MSKGFLARTFDDPSLVRLQRPEIRKKLSITRGIVTLAFIGFMAFLGFRGMFESFAVTVGALVALFAIFVVTTGRLNGSTGGITEIPRRDLDEVQLEVREKAYARAYRIVGLDATRRRSRARTGGTLTGGGDGALQLNVVDAGRNGRYR